MRGNEPAHAIKGEKMATIGWFDGLWEGECNRDWFNSEVEE